MTRPRPASSFGPPPPREPSEEPGSAARTAETPPPRRVRASSFGPPPAEAPGAPPEPPSPPAEPPAPWTPEADGAAPARAEDVVSVEATTPQPTPPAPRPEHKGEPKKGKRGLFGWMHKAEPAPAPAPVAPPPAPVSPAPPPAPPPPPPPAPPPPVEPLPPVAAAPEPTPAEAAAPEPVPEAVPAPAPVIEPVPEPLPEEPVSPAPNPWAAPVVNVTEVATDEAPEALPEAPPEPLPSPEPLQARDEPEAVPAAAEPWAEPRRRRRPDGVRSSARPLPPPPGSEMTAALPPVAGAEAEAEPTVTPTEPPPSPAFHIDPAMAAQIVDAVKIYGSGDTAVRALDRISLGFVRGRFTAIMGPSGSGKSTLMHCLAGLDRLSAGAVFIGGVELGRLTDKALTQLRRDRVGFVFQTYNLVPTLTAIENITLPLDLARAKRDKEWIDSVIDTLRIRDRLTHKPDQLSGGQQQRVAVARALVTRPEIIFADEPTGNLDTRAGAEVLGILKTSVRDLGQTVVMVTHDPVAAGYADRAVFLVDGRVVSEMHEPTAERVLDEMKTLGG